MEMDYRGAEFMESLEKLAYAINGQVWHSGGGIYGVLVLCDEFERPYSVIRPGHYLFGFADGTLGWDLLDNDGELIGSGVTDMTVPGALPQSCDMLPEVIDRCLQVIENREIDTITMITCSDPHTYHVGDAVIYSMFPLVTDGTGIAQLDGIVSTGKTLADMNQQGIGDTCLWDNVASVRPA